MITEKKLRMPPDTINFSIIGKRASRPADYLWNIKLLTGPVLNVFWN